MSLVGTWRIDAATGDSPFLTGTSVEITAQGQVISGVITSPPGIFSQDQDVLVITAGSVYWQFVLSNLFNGRQAMFGFSWTVTLPDAMGAWVSDPQGTP